MLVALASLLLAAPPSPAPPSPPPNLPAAVYRRAGSAS